MITFGFILFIVVLVIIGFVKNQKAESQEKKREELTASGVLSPYRDFMSETVPALLVDYETFRPSYFTKFSDQFSRDGSTASFSPEDLLDDVSPDRAAWVLNHCQLIASKRFHQSKSLSDAAEAGFEVELKVARACPGCPHVPVEKVYNPAKAPVYPCADCKEEQPCDIWYKVLS